MHCDKVTFIKVLCLRVYNCYSAVVLKFISHFLLDGDNFRAIGASHMTVYGKHTNMATMQNFEFISDKFNMYIIYTRNNFVKMK
jgi:hypothetical protein